MLVKGLEEVSFEEKSDFLEDNKGWLKTLLVEITLEREVVRDKDVELDTVVKIVCDEVVTTEHEDVTTVEEESTDFLLKES